MSDLVKCTCYAAPMTGVMQSFAHMGDKTTCMICRRQITSEAEQAWRALIAENEAEFWEEKYDNLLMNIGGVSPG